MRLEGARPNAPAQPEQKLAGYTNYLLDHDPRRWRTHIPNYGRVRYHNVYPGIDVVYYGNPRELEFDFILAPGADPRRIQIALNNSDLQIRLPRIYQKGRTVEGRAIRHNNRVTFELASYDHSKPLVIDPVLSYASIFGGGGPDQGRAIAVDSTGAVYLAGDAFDVNFPVVNGQPGNSFFLAKLNPAGNALVFSTYLSHSNDNPSGPASYAVDASGSVYLTRAGSLGAALAGSGSLIECRTIFPDVYVAKLSPDGTSLVYGGCIGGAQTDVPTAIAVDASGNAYITGWTQSPDFPLVNQLQSGFPNKPGLEAGFVFKLSPSGTLIYSTFLGSVLPNPHIIVAADPAGNAYIAGSTGAPDFPLKNAIQDQFSGISSPFAAKINADGLDFVYSTYFGGRSLDQISAIAADPSGSTYLAGTTVSAGFPTTANAYQTKFNGVSAFKTSDGAANWSRSDSGLPGATSSVAVDPRNPSTVYAVSANRLFKSVDRGVTWQATGATSVGTVWVDPVDSSVFASSFAGPPDDPNIPNNLLRSRDGGATFTTIRLGLLLYGFINNLVFDPKNASVIYLRWGGSGSGNGMQSGDGVYKSIDGGDTWTPTAVSGGGDGSGGMATDPSHPSTLYVSTRKGLLRSDDAGNTFTTVNPNIIASQLLFDSASTLYAVLSASNGASNGSVLINSGGTFISKALPSFGGTLVIDPTNNSTWYLASFASNNNAGIYKSTDAGDSWQLVSNGLPDPKTTGSLALDPSAPATLYLGVAPPSDAFFAKLSPDGSTLKYSTYLGGIRADSANAVAVDALGNAYLAGATASLDFPLNAPFRSTGSGFLAKFDSTDVLQWSSLLGDTTPVAMALGPAGEVYVTGSSASAAFSTPNGIGPFISSNFYETSDSGTTWATNPVPANTPPIPIVTVDPQTPSRVYALAGYLYRTENGGQDWTQLGRPAVVPSGNALALVLDTLNPTTMYSVSTSTAAVTKSTDGGLTWTSYQIVPPSQPPIGGGPPIGNLAIDAKTPTTLYVALFTRGIYKSTDGAATWTPTGPPNAQEPWAIAVDPLSPAVVYASASAFGPPTIDPFANGSLYRSIDGGTSWSKINNGLPAGWIAFALIPDPSVPGRIYARGPEQLDPSASQLYRSDDRGDHWIPIGSGLPQGLYSLAVDPVHPSVVYAGPTVGGLYRSTDAGANFTLMPGLRRPSVGSIAIDPANPSKIYTGTSIDASDAIVMKITQ
jgi:photosystem II stability/assembly factor-like uncharacterized protein